MASSDQTTRSGVIEQLTRQSQVGGYAPQVYGNWLYGMLDGRPRFTWLEAERMRRDPQVQLGLRILRAPLWGVTWKVSADTPTVERWVDRELTRVYRRMLPKIVRFYEYGIAGGELTFVARPGRDGRKTRVHFQDFYEVHPRDSRPLVYKEGVRTGKLAGLRVHNIPNAGTILLDRRHAFWFSGESEFGEWWGRPRLVGAYEPFVEKRGRHGAIDSRRLFYRKGAFKGPFMRYPVGETNLGTTASPVMVSNQDIAREIAEKFENGGVLALPNAKTEGTNDFAWSWEDPRAFADAAGFLEYPKALDKEILIGLGIPPELVDAATVGSGYSGRAIPAQVFFSSIDEVAWLVVEAIDRQVIRPLVRLNFGHAGYQIEVDSLAKLVATGPPGPGGAPGAGGSPAGLPPGGGGGGGGVPYQGPRGGIGTRDPVTGRVHYGKPKVRLSHRAQKPARRKAGAGDLRRALLLAMLEFQRRAHKAGDPESAGPYCAALADLAGDARLARSLRLSWTAAQTKRGTTKAVGVGEDAGRVLYGKRALSALRFQEGHEGRSWREHRGHVQRSTEAAKGIVLKVSSRKDVSAAELKQLATHLPALPVARLKVTRLLLGASWGGRKLKRSGMLDALMDHVRGMVDGAEAKTAKARQRKAKKAAPKDTVIAAVQRLGGIDPNSLAFKAHYSNVGEAGEDHIPVGIFRKGGGGLDEIAQEMQSAGLITVPDGAHPSEYLLDQIRERAHTHAADLSDEYEKALHEHYRLLQDEHDAADRPAVEEAVRLGEAAGVAEGAERARGEDGGDAPARPGQEDLAGDPADFPFGANAPAEPARPAAPSDAAAVAGELHKTYKSLPPKKPGDADRRIPGREAVADLIDRAQKIARPLAEGISSFLRGGKRYSYRMFHVARELLERHEREAGKGPAPEEHPDVAEAFARVQRLYDSSPELYDTPRAKAEPLVSAWLHHAKAGNARVAAALEGRLKAAGAVAVHAAGEAASFDGKVHESEQAVSDGAPVRVVRAGWKMAGDRGPPLQRALVEKAPAPEKPGPAPQAGPDKAPWQMSPEEAEAAGLTFFRTGQGSLYARHPKTGQTIRVKSPHAGHDAKDAGLKRSSERTVYVDPEHARRIGMWQTSSASGKRLVLHGGHVHLASKNAATGAYGRDGAPIPFHAEPAPGLSPLELNDRSGREIHPSLSGGEVWSGSHPGSPITETVPTRAGHAELTAAAKAAGQAVHEPAPAAQSEHPADRDHTAEINAIAPGGNAYVAGHLVRRMADGRFQVESGGVYRAAADAQAVSAKIKSAWARQKFQQPEIDRALARADAHEDPDPFADPKAAEEQSARRAKVPVAAKAVSLDPHTRGRVGVVARDDAGGMSLVLAGGDRASHFEPLDPAHSWRGPAADKPAAGLFGEPEGETPAPAAPEAKPAFGPHVEDLHRRLEGRTRATTHGEANAMMRDVARLTDAEARELLRRGDFPGTGPDPKRQLAETIYDRQGAKVRGTMLKPVHLRTPAEKAEADAWHDEPMQSVDDAFAAAKAGGAAQPAGKPIDPADGRALAEAAHEAAAKLPAWNGDAHDPATPYPHKVYLSHAYEALKPRLPAGATLDDFKAALSRHNAAGALKLSPIDMPQVSADPAAHAASETFGDMRALELPRGYAPPTAPLDNAGKFAKTLDTGAESQGGGAGHGEGHLEGAGGRGAPGGLPAGQRVGGATPEGLESRALGGAGGRPGELPPGPDARRARAVRGADGRGDAAGDRPGDGAPRPARKPRRVGGPPRDEHGTRLGGGLDGAAPALPEPTPHEQSVAEPPTPENPTDVSAGNFRYPDRDFVKAGKKAKFNANLAALRTLRHIQAEGRETATPEEQAILSKWSGWGQFPGVFNEFWDSDFRKRLESEGVTYQQWEQEREHWTEERQAVRGLMSDEEWEAAKRSTLNAHYTHPDVVDAHWQIARKLGFDGGRYLETSAGIGYYLGLMPQELAARTRSSAVELDPSTGAMLKLLYPASNVQVQGFQNHLAPDHHYDLVASNVPFGAYKVRDPRYDKHQANIHDYFFLKSADKVRPGGLVMHITSTGTLDKPDGKVREALHDAGMELVGAIRFPGAAHKENAGTDVVTDMVILRKRLPGEEPGDRSWLETTTVPDPAGGEPIPVNKYFAANPHMVLGTLDRTGSMYKGNSVNVSRTEDYEDRLRAAIDKLPAGIMSARKAPAKRFAPEVLPAPGEVKDGGFHHEGGKIFVRQGGGMVEQDLAPAARKKIVAHLGVRDALRAVINAETAGGDATEARAALNAAYDQFVKEHGPLNAPGNKRAFATDPDSPPLLALEKYDPKAKKAQKADIFTKSTISAVKPVEKVSPGDVAEGLGVSLHEHGRLDVDHVARLTGLHREEVGRRLSAQGLAYEDPSHGWQPADHYLSGNVRRKLALARAAAASDPRYQSNVAALEKVQPEDIHHDDIDVKLGSHWVPGSDVQEFAAKLLGASPDHFEVRYVPGTGEWKADYTNRGRYTATSNTANAVWGAGGQNFLALLEAGLNNTPVTITKPDPAGGDKRVVDREATDAAMSKVQEIKNEFRDWVWTDDERRERLHRHYNDHFNNVRLVRYDGSHQQFPGKNPSVELRPHQKDAVWQVVTTGKGLWGHEVGTGKTFTMIAGAMELRRLGLAKKPAIVCKKANVEAITQDALKLYPGAKILSTADMFDAQNRKRTISRIATGDYDMVILTHDHMDLMAMRPETQEKYIREELKELEAAYEEAWEESGGKKNDRVVKQLAKAKENLQAKLQEALKAEKKDDAIYFEDSGIDHVFVDEAHRYKSLPIYTKMRNLKGIPTSRSDRATTMLMRTRWLMEQNGGRGVVFATGTPVANTMAELYSMQRYLQPEELQERGLKTFDAWASTFGDVETKMEYTATGEYKPVSRFSKFVNLPELMQISRQMLDVKRADDLKNPDGSPVVKRPKRKDAVTTAPKSEGVARLMDDLKARAAALKGKQPGQSDDNMLAICTDGRKGSIDLRMVDAGAADDPESKTNQMVRQVLDISKGNPGKTQMIFSDIGANPMANGFHLFGDIIAKLEEGGIPRDQIADFTKLEGAKKEEAMEGLRQGKIRVALGGTETLGTGVNAQHKLLALHHLDCPWRPADLEQRDGRGWRHGNENPEVQIHRYVTEGSLDELLWQGIARKSKFIKQVMTTGSAVDRSAKEEDTEELTPEAVMAAASGDPRILEKVQVDEDVKNLQGAKTRHEREQTAFKQQLKNAEAVIEGHQKNIAGFKEAQAHLEANPEFHAKIGDAHHAERPAAAEALEKHLGQMPSWQREVGHYRGLPLVREGGKLFLMTPSGQRLQTGGTLASVEAVARQMPTHQAATEGTLAQYQKDLEQIRAKVGKPFAKAEELAKKAARQKELEKALAGKDEPKEGEGGAAAGKPTVEESANRLTAELERERAEQDYVVTPGRADELLAALREAHTDEEVVAVAKAVTGRGGRTAAQALEYLKADLTAVHRALESQKV